MTTDPAEQLQSENRKARIYAILNDPDRATPIGRLLAWLLAALITVNALLVFIVYDSRLNETAHQLIYIFDMFCTFVFLIEYIARVWTADMVYSNMGPIKARLRYIFSIMGIIDFLAVFPFLLIYTGAFAYQSFNSLRVLRVVRLIKLTRYIKGLNMISNVISSRRQELVPAFAILMILILTASVLMYQFENPIQPEAFDSVFSGVYWAVTTISGTGYGDLTPITFAGRLVGIFTMLCSIAIVAIPAGIITAGFIEEARAERNRQEMARRQHRLEIKKRKAKRQGKRKQKQGYDPKELHGSAEDKQEESNLNDDKNGDSSIKYCPHCGKPLN